MEDFKIQLFYLRQRCDSKIKKFPMVCDLFQEIKSHDYEIYNAEVLLDRGQTRPTVWAWKYAVYRKERKIN